MTETVETKQRSKPNLRTRAKELREKGLHFEAIAKILTDEGYRSKTGKPIKHATAWRATPIYLRGKNFQRKHSTKSVAKEIKQTKNPLHDFFATNKFTMDQAIKLMPVYESLKRGEL
jgi:hypothetical protein